MTASDEVAMRPAAPSMFGAPRWSDGERYDVVFVGVPGAAGSLGTRTPALGPLMLRSQSQLFPLVRDPNRECVGWYDYAAEQVILRGIRMADAGDFVYDRRLGSEQFASLPSVYATLRESTRLLVILGGDHSLTYWLAQSLMGEGLLWFDAHEDATARRGPYPHCGNVVSYIDSMPNVPAIAQVGLRGLVPNVRPAVPAHRMMCRGANQVAACFRARGVTSAAATLDVDVFDPALMPAVASAMPGGLQVDDVLKVLAGVVDHGIAIPVLEVAEFSPLTESDAVHALTLVNFLLRGIAACCRL